MGDNVNQFFDALGISADEVPETSAVDVATAAADAVAADTAQRQQTDTRALTQVLAKPFLIKRVR